MSLAPEGTSTDFERGLGPCAQGRMKIRFDDRNSASTQRQISTALWASLREGEALGKSSCNVMSSERE